MSRRNKILSRKLVLILLSTKDSKKAYVYKTYLLSSKAFFSGRRIFSQVKMTFNRNFFQVYLVLFLYHTPFVKGQALKTQFFNRTVQSFKKF